MRFEAPFLRQGRQGKAALQELRGDTEQIAKHACRA